MRKTIGAQGGTGLAVVVRTGRWPATPSQDGSRGQGSLVPRGGIPPLPTSAPHPWPGTWDLMSYRQALLTIPGQEASRREAGRAGQAMAGGGGVWNVHTPLPLAACPGHAPWREVFDRMRPTRGSHSSLLGHSRPRPPRLLLAPATPGLRWLSAKPRNVPAGCTAAVPGTGTTKHRLSLRCGRTGCSLPGVTHEPGRDGGTG